MIAIEVDGEFLDMAGAKVRLKLVSQVFSREFIAQSYSYPFSLPWTPTNARLLNHIDRIANTASAAPVVGRLWLGGLAWRPCELVFRSFKNGLYDVDLRVPEDQLILDLKGKTLQDYAYGGPFSILPAGLTPPTADYDAEYGAHTGDIDATPFVFAPIRNLRRFGGRPEAYTNMDPDEPAYLENIPDDYINYYNAVQTYDWFYMVSDPEMEFWWHEFSPFFYLAYIMEELVDALGFTLAGDVFQDEEVRRQVIIGNMHMFLLLQDEYPGIAVNNSETDIPVGNALPQMTLYSFFVKLMRRYNAVVKVRNGTFTFQSLNSILESIDVLDLTEHAEREASYEADEQEGYVVASLKEPLEKVDELKVLPGDPDYTVDGVPDLASLTPTGGEIAYVSNAQAYYQYETTRTEWVPFSYGPYPLEEGNMEVKLDVGVVLTKMYSGEDTLASGRMWLLPWMDQGLSDAQQDPHSIGDNRVTELRLLYYRGLQEDSAAETYPLLTTGTQDYAGNTIAGATQCERIDGTGGIYETWYSQWVTILTQNRVVERKVRMPLHELLSFDFTRKVRIDGINYLVRTIDVEVTTEGIGLATMDMVKV